MARKKAEKKKGPATTGKTGPGSKTVKRKLTDYERIRQALPEELEANDGDLLRPSMFHLLPLSGCVVPRILRENNLESKPYSYLRHADGRRECIEFNQVLTLASGECLFFRDHQESGVGAGWSASSRTRWLEGEPCPDATDVFRRLRDRIAEYIDFPDDLGTQYDVIALFAMCTYSYSVWPAVPYLHVKGTAGTGKTRLLDILSLLVFRPFFSSELTTAVLFRTIQAVGGTTILDELEGLQTKTPRSEAIKTILNAGYRAGGKAHRSDMSPNANFKTQAFDVFGPKVLGSIDEFPETLMSRCIAVQMIKAPPASAASARQLCTKDEMWQKLRDDLHMIAMEHGAVWLKLTEDEASANGLHSRERELWQPLLALAKWLDDQNPTGLWERLHKHAILMVECYRVTSIPEEDEIVLQALAKLVLNQRKHPRMQMPTSKDVLNAVKAVHEDGFYGWTPQRLAALLRRYNIHSRQSGNRRPIVTNIRQLKQIETAYGLKLVARWPNESEDGKK